MATRHPFSKCVIHTILSQLIASSIVHNLSLSRFFTFYFLLTCFMRNFCFCYVAMDFISINSMISNKYIFRITLEFMFFSKNKMLLYWQIFFLISLRSFSFPLNHYEVSTKGILGNQPLQYCHRGFHSQYKDNLGNGE